MAVNSGNSGLGSPGAAEHGAHGAEHPGTIHILAGLQSLHDRLDEIERAALRHNTRSLQSYIPAWCRPTRGETRWQVALCTAAAIALQLPVPEGLNLAHPFWVLPAVEGVLLLLLVVANPHRINRESRGLRTLALGLAALMSVANIWAATRLVIELVHGKGPTTGTALLVTGGAIWLTNVIVFALWYWEFDQGGPVARALCKPKGFPDFMFPQMTVSDHPNLAPEDWEPTFVDYFYLAFTNATAFSPTDTMPMSRWAKLAMTLQSVVSLVTVALVVSRAVNILQ